jgi:hypothetical protein
MGVQGMLGVRACLLLLKALLLLNEPGLQDDLGFIVDGIPRTATQVKCPHSALLLVAVADVM